MNGALITTGSDKLFNYLNDKGLTDLTKGDFKKYFEQPTFQDNVYKKLYENGYYNGTTEMFISEFVLGEETPKPSLLSNSKITVTSKDGTESTLANRASEVASNRFNPQEDFDELLLDLSSSSMLSEQARQRVSNLAFQDDGGGLYSVVDNDGNVISNIDYYEGGRGVTSYYRRRNNLNKVVQDVSNYAQQADLDRFKDAYKTGTGLNYDILGPGEEPRYSYAGFGTSSPTQPTAEETPVSEDGTPMMVAPGMAQVTQEEMETGVVQVSETAAFEYAKNVLSKGEFNLDGAIESVNNSDGKTMTIGNTDYIVTSAEEQGEMGGDFSLVLNARAKNDERIQAVDKEISEVEYSIKSINMEAEEAGGLDQLPQERRSMLDAYTIS